MVCMVAVNQVVQLVKHMVLVAMEHQCQQLVNIVVHRIQSDPTALAGEGHLVVAQALSGEFPCGPKATGN